jgi:DNA-binding response OmpR family regulator
VVDDDPSVRTALKRLIFSAGYEVATFGSAEELLTSGQRDLPDVFVIDVRMPGRSGLELQRELAASGSRTPVIFITAYQDDQARALAHKAGVVAYLEKPVDGEVLLDAIRAGLQRQPFEVPNARHPDPQGVAFLPEHSDPTSENDTMPRDGKGEQKVEQTLSRARQKTMTPWPKNPIIYEINTWVWLHELTRKYGRAIRLGNVPAKEWDGIAALRVHAVWLMGVWERSPAGRRVAQRHPALEAEYLQVLPDVSPDDVVGSPYCVHRYLVDERLGGPKGLATARRRLATRGVRLILDFVPNHVARDHPWILEHPEYFIQGSADDLTSTSREFFEAGGKVFAFGRDPWFPPWTDTAQLNAFHLGLRGATVEAIAGVAEQCDGMRCDMAMLLINGIFAQTWGTRAGIQPAQEFWREVIGAVRLKYPEVLFIAEAYWDLEWELQEQGFDYCYDKGLYDRLAHGSAESVRLHLVADVAYQEKLVRFIENHDEPRAAAAFGDARSRAAAVAMATLPGAKLFHEGQIEGRRARLPVQLGRLPVEEPDRGFQTFYRRLLAVMSRPLFRDGEWFLCERAGWPDNSGYLNFLAWGWQKGSERWVVVVNLSGCRSQARVRLPWSDLAGQRWRLADAFDDEVYDRDGVEMIDPGLYVDLEPWKFHLLHLERR